MHPAKQFSPPDPIAAAVADLLDETSDGFAQSDREMMSWAEGLLTAAAIGPERTYPDEWPRAVFGAEHRFEDAEQAQSAIGMLGLMYNAILHDLQHLGAEYTPYFLDHADDGEEVGLAQEWAAGFVRGMQLRGTAWEGLIGSEQGKLNLAVVVAFLPDALMPKASAEEIAKMREDALAWLGSAVFEISEFWKARAKRPERAPVDPHRKIGRNEPCPCGSGSKYKKCCLERAA